MNKTFLTIKEAEDIVDNMYQKRWEECGVIDKNAKLMGNIDNLELSNLEKASIVLLNEELRLKQENQVLEKQLQQRDNIINKAREKIKLLGKFDGKTCTRGFQMWVADFNNLLEILNIDKGDD